jgi:hypothetical protein
MAFKNFHNTSKSASKKARKRISQAKKRDEEVLQVITWPDRLVRVTGRSAMRAANAAIDKGSEEVSGPKASSEAKLTRERDRVAKAASAAEDEGQEEKVQATDPSTEPNLTDKAPADEDVMSTVRMRGGKSQWHDDENDALCCCTVL